MDGSPLVAARKAFAIEAGALEVASSSIDDATILEAVELLAGVPRIGCSGCGHSGIACRHFAHLLCCIERPARFISPSEAVHGAMGFLQAGDVMVLASRGGKTEELLPMLSICRAKQVGVICMTENLESPLAKGADLVVPTVVTRETDRYNCQGTTSFAVLNAVFDALQAALIERIGYENEHFAVIHPGGAVGQRLQEKKQ